MKPLVTDPRNAAPFSWAVDSIRQAGKEFSSKETTQHEVAIPASGTADVAHKVGHKPKGASVVAGPASAVSNITMDQYHVHVTNSTASPITVTISVIP